MDKNMYDMELMFYEHFFNFKKESFIYRNKKYLFKYLYGNDVLLCDHIKKFLSIYDISYYITNDIQLQAYLFYKYDKFHRNGDLPAIQIFISNNICIYIYYKNGLIHRDNEDPAIIKYVNNYIEVEKYYKNGKKHRDNDKPASIDKSVSYMSKCRIEIKYYINGNLHRDGDNPAFLIYDKNTNILRQKMYFKEGILKRENGNPHIIYDSKGNEKLY